MQRICGFCLKELPLLAFGKRKFCTNACKARAFRHLQKTSISEMTEDNLGKIILEEWEKGEFIGFKLWKEQMQLSGSRMDFVGNSNEKEQILVVELKKVGDEQHIGQVLRYGREVISWLISQPRSPIPSDMAFEEAWNMIYPRHLRLAIAAPMFTERFGKAIDVLSAGGIEIEEICLDYSVEYEPPLSSPTKIIPIVPMKEVRDDVQYEKYNF
ncbi:hypothetical protein LCGC14_1643130 [marine sediment metagenome]|uniref:DUF91 domain-containing protein n=1 Tax=marine sediment metagenome TaxID=412755 RepID=A0A0F9KYU0_9ZZZZ